MLNKETVFKKYSQNLEMVSGIVFPEKADKLRGKYVCPICLRDFAIEYLNSTLKNHLTEEHVPPKSVGWKRKILTCKECNSSQGGILDSQLSKLLLTKAFNKNTPGATINGKFVFKKDFIVRGTASINKDGKLQVNVDTKRTNPREMESVKEIISQSDIADIQASWQSGDLKRAMISMIRAAYLWGFAEFGYAFVFNRNFDRIREQILYPDRNLYFERFILGGEFPQHWEGIHILTEPSEAESYAVIMNLNAHGISDEICVLLPGADENGLERIERLKNEIKGNAPDLAFVPLIDETLLLDPEKCIFLLSYWFEKYPPPLRPE